MIIWQGWGILVVLIGALFTAPLGFGAASLLGEDNAAVGAGTGLILAAIAVYLAGNKLNAPVQGYDPSTGQPVMYRNRHTFFFVPMQYWGFILPVLGVIVISTMFFAPAA
ncbi:MAG TPA: hypothetical protein H9836_01905 [Candidatus Nocardiopsis merdipullorum]|nr:hypothetical protein [Candidatus Nocardiopsis merdipullorum]